MESLSFNLLLVQSGSIYISIQNEDVLYVNSSNGKTILFHKDGRQFTTSKTLNKTAELLSSDTFIIINRNVAINRLMIQSVIAGDSVVIKLQGGKEFQLSRRRQKEFFAQMKRL